MAWGVQEDHSLPYPFIKEVIIFLFNPFYYFKNKYFRVNIFYTRYGYKDYGYESDSQDNTVYEVKKKEIKRGQRKNQ